jgi:membrane fusion protein, copper/silver efflux system
MAVTRPRIIALSMTIAGLGIGLWWMTHGTQTTGAGQGQAPASTAADAERTPLYWYDPMHPDKHFDAPGRSPFMDMALVPKYGEPTDAARVRVAPGMVQRLGIRTAPVTVGSLAQRVEATGRIEVDERTLRQITVRAAGWVEVLRVRADGDPVKRGQVLAEVFSPALDTAQREFLLALGTGQAPLIDAARAQLRTLGIDDVQVAELERTRTASRRTNVYSPIDGYVMRLMAREGAAVEPDGTLFELASHDPVWIIASIPEAQADWIAVGDAVEAHVAAHSMRGFEGRVDYLYPALDSTTRTRRARIVLPNHDDALHPGMYAQVSLAGRGVRDVLLVPADAVIRTGTRAVVIVAESSGRYRPAPVRLGSEYDGNIAVIDGLVAGEQVVVSGQFLIDSEASLQGAFRRLNQDGDRDVVPPAAAGATP